MILPLFEYSSNIINILAISNLYFKFDLIKIILHDFILLPSFKKIYMFKRQEKRLWANTFLLKKITRWYGDNFVLGQISIWLLNPINRGWRKKRRHPSNLTRKLQSYYTELYICQSLWISNCNQKSWEILRNSY